MESQLIKLQHKFRREGGITIRTTRYQLDSEGCVEVPPDHATLLLQGKCWGEPGSWGVHIPIPNFSNTEKGKGRRPRTREELLMAAQAEGISVEEKKEPQQAQPPIEVVEKEDSEENGTAMTSKKKEELINIAVRLGIKKGKAVQAKKATLVEWISAAARS